MVKLIDRSFEATRSQDLQVAEPIICGQLATLNFNTTFPSILGTPLVRYQVIQYCQTVEEHILASFFMMEAFHHEELPVHGIVCLIQKRRGGRHLTIPKQRIPTSFLLANPGAYGLSIDNASCLGDFFAETSQFLAKGTQVIGFAFLTLLKYLEQVEAENLARGPGNGFELRENPPGCMKQAVAYSNSRKECAHTLDGTLKAVGENPFGTIGRVHFQSILLKLSIGSLKCFCGFVRADLSVVYPRCQMTRPQTMVGRYTFSDRQ